MKNYPRFNEVEQIQKIQLQLDELRLFQDLLRGNLELEDHFHNKALEMAHGLQPWIDALEISVKK